MNAVIFHRAKLIAMNFSSRLRRRFSRKCGGASTRVFLLLSLAISGGRSAPASAPQFQLALPGYKFSLPRDHASHPQFATEWWYYTGHLRAKNGRKFGYQLTFFRQALAPQIAPRKSSWAARDIIFAHFALTDENRNRFFFSDRISRAAMGLAKAETSTPHVFLGGWAMQISPRTQTLRAASRDDNSQDNASTRAEKSAAFFAINLTQTPRKPFVIHGENGVSQKSAGRGRASHYGSFTRLQTLGSVQIENETFPVVGESWFDHEFGSNQLAKNQVGWDWFSLQLSDGRELMLYQLRNRNGRIDAFSSGTLVEKNGRATHLKISDFSIRPLTKWRSDLSGATYPSRWRIRVPRAKIDIEIVPTIANQELRTQRAARITYWEGSARVLAPGGREIGRGYVELTGYDKPFAGTF